MFEIRDVDYFECESNKKFGVDLNFLFLLNPTFLFILKMYIKSYFILIAIQYPKEPVLSTNIVYVYNLLTQP